MNINIKKIQLIIYDFDGVMTDNKVFVFEDGKEAVLCNRSDGLAVKKIKECGVRQIIVSTETNPVVRKRAEKLGIEVIQGVDKKEKIVREFCLNNDYDLKNVIFIGNDVNDIEAMKLVGIPVAPSDAYCDVLQVAKIVMKTPGGGGVIRELFELLA